MPAKQPVKKNAKLKTRVPEENPNAFKLWINKDVLVSLGRQIAGVYPPFDQKTFVSLAPALEPLELKGRIRAVREQLRRLLPQNYVSALKILMASTKSGKLSGFALWPYTDFIQTYGLERPKESLVALAELTELFTAEFGVRPFLAQDPDASLAFLKTCAKSKNEHLRRWASEGSRPRLPWGERLNIFIEQPKKTLPILELLKNDESLYVRKSVANHLNDISKDHPELVVKLLKRWQHETKPEHLEYIQWITHRALRTLIKNGDVGALSAVGVSAKPKVALTGLTLDKSNYKMGDRLAISFELASLAKSKQTIVVDYIIHFVKSNKTTSPKVFKLKRFELAGNSKVQVMKEHHLKEITTRVYYPGAHAIEIQVNGNVMARRDWLLKI
jgi:3-methyladenine DNA glycosylase AlkC